MFDARLFGEKVDGSSRKGSPGTSAADVTSTSTSDEVEESSPKAAAINKPASDSASRGEEGEWSHSQGQQYDYEQQQGYAYGGQEGNEPYYTQEAGPPQANEHSQDQYANPQYQQQGTGSYEGSSTAGHSLEGEYSPPTGHADPSSYPQHQHQYQHHYQHYQGGYPPQGQGQQGYVPPQGSDGSNATSHLTAPSYAQGPYPQQTFPSHSGPSHHQHQHHQQQHSNHQHQQHQPPHSGMITPDSQYTPPATPPMRSSPAASAHTSPHPTHMVQPLPGSYPPPHHLHAPQQHPQHQPQQQQQQEQRPPPQQQEGEQGDNEPEMRSHFFSQALPPSAQEQQQSQANLHRLHNPQGSQPAPNARGGGGKWTSANSRTSSRSESPMMTAVHQQGHGQHHMSTPPHQSSPSKHGQSNSNTPPQQAQQAQPQQQAQARAQPLYQLPVSSDPPQVLQDYLGFTFTQPYYGNLHSFIETVTPKFNAGLVPYSNTGLMESSFVLKDMWESLKHPFGATVPLERGFINPHKTTPSKAVYYIPTLSGLYLTFADGVPERRRNELAVPMMMQRSSSFFEQPSAAPASAASGGGARSGSAGAKTTTVSNGDEGKSDDGGSSNEAGEAAEPSQEGGSDGAQRQHQQPSYTVSADGIYFAVEAKPELRLPLYDQIERLAAEGGYPGLMTARNTEFTHTSWFAVLWQPIYCHDHTPQRSCGSFLAFYLLRPPLIPQNSPHVFRCDFASFDPPLWTLGDEELKRNFTPQPTASAATPPNGVSDPSGVVLTSVNGDEELDANGNGGGTLSSALGHSGGTTAGGSSMYADSMSHESEGSCRCIVPVCGLLPNRARTDLWYQPLELTPTNTLYYAPVFLFVSALQLITIHERFLDALWSDCKLEDYYHFLRHEKLLTDLYRMLS